MYVKILGQLVCIYFENCVFFRQCGLLLRPEKGLLDLFRSEHQIVLVPFKKQ